MNNVISWIKSNPFHVVCLVIMLIAAVAFYFPIYTSGSSFRGELESRTSVPNKLKSFERTSVNIPPSKADEEVRKVQMVATQVNIEKLDEIYKNFKSEFESITNVARDWNKAQDGLPPHVPMLDGLFPVALTQSIRFDAKQAYLDEITKLYKQLNPGTPPSAAEIKAKFDDIENGFRSRLIDQKNLTAKQQADLNKQFALALEQMIINESKQASIYVEPVNLDANNLTNWKPGPFDVATWPQSGNAPTMRDLWDSQMELWIQQDLVQAILIANRSEDPNTPILVENAPVKRLLSIKVRDGYIGIRDSGIGKSLEELQNANNLGSSSGGNEDVENPGRVKDNFFASGTGRATNEVYDVKHVKMSVIVQSREISKLMNALNSVNFTTVISMSVDDIDEYDHFRKGYYYGFGVDTVKLDLTIETLWLRSWTAGHESEEAAKKNGEDFNPGLMPDYVRNYLGLKPRNVEQLRQQLEEVNAKPN